jgi:hypothetical protein
MLVQFTVRRVLDAARGSLVELALMHPDRPADGPTQWLWVEANRVTSLHLIDERDPATRVFDGAILTMDGLHAELHWASGRADALDADPACTLSPACQRLVHQHLN